MNKLRNIYTIWREARNISTKEWEIYYFKIKTILFIINLRWNYAICYGQVQVQKRDFSIRRIRLIQLKFGGIYLIWPTIVWHVQYIYEIWLKII